MRVELRCASMISGGQYVMTCGTALMLLWSAGSWDMEVSRNQCGLIGVNMSKPRTSELGYQFFKYTYLSWILPHVSDAAIEYNNCRQ